MPAVTTMMTPTPAATTAGLVVELSKESEDGGGGGGEDGESSDGRGEPDELESVPSKPEVQMYPL